MSCNSDKFPISGGIDPESSLNCNFLNQKFKKRFEKKEINEITKFLSLLNFLIRKE